MGPLALWHPCDPFPGPKCVIRVDTLEDPWPERQELSEWGGAMAPCGLTVPLVGCSGGHWQIWGMLIPRGRTKASFVRSRFCCQIWRGSQGSGQWCPGCGFRGGISSGFRSPLGWIPSWSKVALHLMFLVKNGSGTGASGVRKQRSLRGGHDGVFLSQPDLGRKAVPVDLATGFVWMSSRPGEQQGCFFVFSVQDDFCSFNPDRAVLFYWCSQRYWTNIYPSHNSP